MKLTLHIDRLMGELHHLASFSDCPLTVDTSLPQPQRAVTRIVFSRCDLEARAWFKERVEASGFAWREDSVGNVIVSWPGSAPHLPPIGTGSHIDAIPFAGMYDGTVGVLGALEAMRALKEAGFTPTRSIELILFTSEEPTRFGIGCLGSRLLSGALSPLEADDLPDRLPVDHPEAIVGGTLATVRQAAGFHGRLSEVPMQAGSLAAWVELHIEQGPLLERRGNDLGVVTHIAGPASYRYVVEGLGGHAGALLMPDRRDALCAAAELVLAIERFTVDANREANDGHNSVATVGKMDVFPGAVNAVPSRVEFMLDVRDTNAGNRAGVLRHIRTAVQEISKRRKVRIHEDCINSDLPTQCDPTLVKLLMDTSLRLGARPERLVSRAYHDSSFMARIAPVAMLFIPCRGGVSHRPDEYATPQAIELGTRVLAHTLATLSADNTDTALPHRGID